MYLVLLYKVFDWYNDVWLITSRWVIDIDWQYFASNINYVDYHSIHGVEIERNSIFDWLLWKGDIVIEMISEHNEFALADAVNPQWIVEYIQAVVDEIKHGGTEEKTHQQSFEVLLETLTQMVKEHLEQKWYPKEDSKEYEQTIKKALRRTSTIDLRDSNWSSESSSI